MTFSDAWTYEGRAYNAPNVFENFQSSVYEMDIFMHEKTYFLIDKNNYILLLQ